MMAKRVQCNGELGGGGGGDQGWWPWAEQLSAALICSTVVVISPLTVATDSALSFDDGRLLTRIWNATVTTDRRQRPCRPAARGGERPALLVDAPPPSPGGHRGGW